VNSEGRGTREEGEERREKGKAKREIQQHYNDKGWNFRRWSVGQDAFAGSC
jgi:hypothetical protein